jgi:hypothetical protein
MYANAYTTAPNIQPKEWRTGEIEYCWTGLVSGDALVMYTRNYDELNFSMRSYYNVPSSAGCHVVPYFENGQTIWYYFHSIQSGEMSPATITFKQSPPVTAYIVNLPEFLDTFEPSLNELNETLENTFKPSIASQTNLMNAIQNISNSLGVNALEQKMLDIKSHIDNSKASLTTPFSDDGVGTFTGGSTGNELPFNKVTKDGLNTYDLNSGTNNVLTFSLPLTKDTNGNWINMKLFTNEQLDKMKWLALARDIAVAVLYIMFAIFLLNRFSPTFKV